METFQQQMAKTQQSHVLMVFSNPARRKDGPFRHWLSGPAFRQISCDDRVLFIDHYALYPARITDQYTPLGFSYLSLCRLCLDGARDGATLISDIQLTFSGQSLCKDIATWLYFPVGEKVGLSPGAPSEYISLAFANPKPGCETAFREWYTTRHIRHALMIPALVNGQVYETTQFQPSGPSVCDYGPSVCDYRIMAIYEMGATPEALMESIPGIDAGKMAWSPTGDTQRFTECFFRRV